MSAEVKQVSSPAAPTNFMACVYCDSGIRITAVAGFRHRPPTLLNQKEKMMKVYELINELQKCPAGSDVSWNDGDGIYGNVNGICPTEHVDDTVIIHIAPADAS